MKIGIFTINDNDNYGNRLQNYATQETIKSLKLDCETIKNIPQLNGKKNMLLKYIKFLIKYKKNKSNRARCFLDFNKNIKYTSNYITPFTTINKKFDYFITGSDQVWNPNFGRMRENDLLDFARNEQKISFSASFGVSQIPLSKHNKVKKSLESFKSISVREDAGKNIIEQITNRKDVEVLVDPTMLLNASEWDKVSKKPEQLNSAKYILNYFLGSLSDNRRKEIERIAKENNCDIINILDKNSPFYQTGPAEFLYLEKNAFLICTDSFHSSVFGIIYNRPFIVFNREDSHVKMNSRIETLINKFNLKNREYNEKEITKENLEHDYTEAYEILEKEREKSMNFLKKALDIKE